MVNLEELQERINKDPNLRERFIAGPAEVLQSEGIVISAHMQDLLEKLIKEQTEDEPIVKGSGVSHPSGPHPRAFGLP